ncbi:MAG: [LysW]-lysine hydrolase [archaeon]
MKKNNELNLLKSLISIYSPSYQEKKCVEFIVSYMKKHGFESFIDESGNAIGVIGKGNKAILMAGHIDTVSGKIPVRVEDNILYGRGSVDAKGPLAAFVLAAKDADLNDKKIIVAGCVEEEVATSKGARNLIGKYKPDYIIIGEPSGTSGITLGYKGRLLCDYTINIDNFHSARGLGACDDVIGFYNKISEYAKPFMHEKIFDSLQWTAREINSEMNGMTQRASVNLSFRLPVGFKIKDLKNYLEKIKGNGTLELYGEEKAIKIDKNNALVRAFMQSIRMHGLEPTFKFKTGTSDMNVLGHAYPNVPIVAYGPGDSALDHTPNEHISLSEFEKSVDVLKEMLNTL